MKRARSDRSGVNSPRANPAVRLARLGRADKHALAAAFVALGLASLAIRLLPFRRTASLLARPIPARAGAAADDPSTIARYRWAVNRWADRVPWRAVCFQRGLALHLLLRRRGIGSIMHYGVTQDSGEGLRAHVWIEAGGRIVMGGEEAAGFARVASFPPALNR